MTDVNDNDEKIRCTAKQVRVRYAPSPTGMQHIGGVRTALFNYLFARSMGGSFILRLEDTDRTRFDEKYVKNLFDTMAWLGLDWDEGGDKGGPNAPYVQSERTELYRKYAQMLVDKGEAYYCFCDSERLERIRKIQTENKMPPGYDRACRSLTPEEVKEKLAAGIPHVVRLKVPLTGETCFHDHLLGDIVWKNEDISPDPVLLKSDGYPTYHLANVVDDHLMGVTHVMRAQEWIPSTPLHIQMYRAFGWEPPEFCHLPMVNGADGKKLSKRHGSTAMDEFRARGYLPEAIVNYVALLGCSYKEGQDVYTLQELSQNFSMDHLNKAPAVFDYKKLEWYNGLYIRAMTDRCLYDHLVPFFTGTGDAAIAVNTGASTGSVPPATDCPKVGPKYSGLTLDAAGRVVCADQSMDMTPEEVEKALMAVMPLIKERLKLLTDAPQMVKFLFTDIPTPAPVDLIPKKCTAAKTAEILWAAEEYVRIIPGLVYEGGQEAAEKAAKDRAEALHVKLGDFMMPIRIAVTGSRVSPPLIGSIMALGTEMAATRIAKARAVIKDANP